MHSAVLLLSLALQIEGGTSMDTGASAAGERLNPNPNPPDAGPAQLDECAWGERFAAPVKPEVKKRWPKATAWVCKNEGGDVVRDAGRYPDGSIEHDYIYDIGHLESAETYWALDAPGCKREECKKVRPRTEFTTNIAHCYGADGSEVDCVVFQGQLTAASSKLLEPFPAPKPKALRFPYDLPALTHRNDDNHFSEELCLDKTADLATHCALESDEAHAIAFSSFVSDRVSVDWLDTADGQVLEQMVISSVELEDCDAMGAAMASAIAATQIKYKQSAKETKGPKFGSKACRDYMAEGLTYYQLSDTNFTIRVDSFWSEGHYTVFISYVNNVVRKQRAEMRAKRQTREMLDSMGKL